MARKRRRQGKNGRPHHRVTVRRKSATVSPLTADGKRDKAARAAAIKAELEQAVGAEAIEQVPTDRLQPNPHNPRRHSDPQVKQIAASIRTFGFLSPIIIDEVDHVLAGHGRLEAAKRELKLKAVPCLRVGSLTAEAKRAFVLADNRLAELSEWDEGLLAAELEELSTLELDFDLELTGFDTVDLDRLLVPEPAPRLREGDSQGLSTDPDDDIPAPLTTPVTRLGDIWQCGDHRVVCGDSVEQDGAIYARLLDGEQATQCVSDPPYNVRIAGHVTGKTGFREFPMASGEMSDTEFVDFLAHFLINVARHSRDGAILHIFMDWRHLEQLLQAARRAKLSLMTVCAWCKPVAGMGSFYKNQHELVAVLKAGQATHINTFGLGARGRSRSTVWRYPAVRGPRRGVNAPDEGGHPTAKPVSLLIDAIRDCSHRGDIVLDPFGGSGSTLIAAERTGRRARLIELDPGYVDLTVQRWQAVFGGPATLAGDGRRFAEIAAARREPNSPPEAAAEGGGDGQEA